MSTPESKLKAKVKAFLKKRGAYFFMPVPSGYGTPTLDFIGCYKGRFFAIETKAPGKEPTMRQEVTLAQMRTAGGFACWMDGEPSDWQELTHWFDQIDCA